MARRRSDSAKRGRAAEGRGSPDVAGDAKAEEAAAGERLGPVSAERENAAENTRKRADALRAINDLAVELAGAPSVEDIYRLAGDRLRALTNARAALVTSFEEEAGELTVNYISGGAGVLSKPVQKVVAFAEGSKFPISEDDRGSMLSERVRSYAGVRELTSGAIPRVVAAALEKTLGSGAVHAVALRYGGEVLGGIALLMPKGAPPYSFEILENFGNVVAAAVRRKHVEVALRESESKLGAMLQSIGDHMSMMDRDLTILWANETAKRIFGDDLVGKGCYAVYHGRSKPCEPYPCITLQAFQDGKSHEHDTQVTDKDGRTVFFHCTANVALRDEKGNPTAVIEISRDVTENRRNEEELCRARETLEERIQERTAELTEALENLRESEERYRKLIEAAPDGVSVTDLDGTITYASPQAAAVHGFDRPEALVGKRAFDFLTEEDRGKAAAEFQAAVEKGFVRGLAFDFLRRDGERFVGELNASLIRGADGRPSGFVATTRDITERTRAEEELRRARDELEKRVEDRTVELKRSNEDLRTFMYIVSHDMRAPLVNLRGFAGELRSALAEVREVTEPVLSRVDEEKRAVLAARLGEDVPEALGFIEASVKRMDYFIEGVLKLSRLGRRELEFEPLDMEALVHETMDTLRHQLEQRRAKFTVGTLPEVVADRTSMEQIVGNLLTNAVLYLDPGRPGEIRVTGGVEDGEALFRVRDTGRGIAARDMNKIFEPFARVGETSVSGEGMGLAYVRALVGRHGGRVCCESEPGVGTTFTFTAPLRLKGGGACD